VRIVGRELPALVIRPLEPAQRRPAVESRAYCSSTRRLPGDPRGTVLNSIKEYDEQYDEIPQNSMNSTPGDSSPNSTNSMVEILLETVPNSIDQYASSMTVSPTEQRQMPGHQGHPEFPQGTARRALNSYDVPPAACPPHSPLRAPLCLIQCCTSV
jgi:hypothetical protein